MKFSEAVQEEECSVNELLSMVPPGQRVSVVPRTLVEPEDSILTEDSARYVFGGELLTWVMRCVSDQWIRDCIGREKIVKTVTVDIIKDDFGEESVPLI